LNEHYTCGFYIFFSFTYLNFINFYEQVIFTKYY
jgi:hypothetical protein